MKKRILSLIVVLSMLTLFVGTITITASAAESGTCGDGLTWTLDDEGTLTISGTGKMSDWRGNLWVPWPSINIKKIVIEEGVTSIGDYAFAYCRYATSVTIPEGVTAIGSYAFNNCDSLSEIAIPNSVVSITRNAFDGCTGFTKITVDEENISYSADTYGVLYNKDKTSVYKYPSASTAKEYILPVNVEFIYQNAFELSKNLETIKVEEGSMWYSSDEYGVLHNKSKDTLVMYPIGNAREDYTVSSEVRTIAANAFSQGENLKRLIIPEGVTTIKEYAFSYNTGLESVEFPQSLTTIENVAFGGCTGLKSIDLPDNLTTVGQGVFSGCSSIKSAILPKNMTSVNATMFKECTALESIIIPNGVTSIGVNSFYKCEKLKSITIPNSLKEVSQFAFQYCMSLTKVNYYGTSQEWQSIYIDQGNNPLSNAAREYIKFTTTTLATDGKTYIVMPVNIPVDKTVVIAFYNNGKLVHYDYDIYYGSEIFFRAKNEYDSVKVFVWDSIDSLNSISVTEEIA